MALLKHGLCHPSPGQAAPLHNPMLYSEELPLLRTPQQGCRGLAAPLSCMGSEGAQSNFDHFQNRGDLVNMLI